MKTCFLLNIRFGSFTVFWNEIHRTYTWLYTWSFLAPPSSQNKTSIFSFQTLWIEVVEHYTTAVIQQTVIADLQLWLGSASGLCLLQFLMISAWDPGCLICLFCIIHATVVGYNCLLTLVAFVHQYPLPHPPAGEMFQLGSTPTPHQLKSACFA